MKTTPRFRLTSMALCALALGATALQAGDGSSASNPVILTQSSIAPYSTVKGYVIDGGLYYEVDSAVDLGNAAALLGTTVKYNHFTVTGASASLSADSLHLAGHASGFDWLTVSNSASATFADANIACADTTAVVTVTSGGTMNLTRMMVLGYKGKGFLNVAGTGTFTSTDADLYIGYTPASACGNVTVSGGGTMTTTGGSNTVYLGYNLSIPSYIDITGNGSTWVANEPVSIGSKGESSELIVSAYGLAVFSDGVTVGSNAKILLDHAYIAVKSDSVLTTAQLEAMNLYYLEGGQPTRIDAALLSNAMAAFTVRTTYFDGTNTLFSSCDKYSVWNAKGIDLTGYTLIYAGSMAVMGTGPANSDTTLDIDSGTTTSNDSHTSAADATWESVYVGYSALNNFLTITGGTFSDTTAVIAMDSGSSGSATITGASSVWTTSGKLRDGVQGTARLCVYKGATVTAGTMTIGEEGSGTCLVSDSGSFLTAASITMGTSGSGTLRILDHALVKTDALTVTKGVVQLNDGFLAVKSDSLLDASAIAALCVYYYDGSDYTELTAANLATLIADKQVSVTYYTSANYVSGNTLYDTFFTGKAVDLTGYTVIHAGERDMTWADIGAASDGWRQSAWYGWFFAGADYGNWIWSPTHGWQYVSDLGDNAIAVWDCAAQSWWYTAEGLYPNIYDYGTDSWYYYMDGTGSSRRFWSWKDAGYVTK